MAGIFISYRRGDTAGYAGRLYDRLAARFGAANVFMDVAGIEAGTDFVEAIEHAVASCDALIVIIGQDWLAAADADGRRRLDDPHDFVRLETATALKRGIRVVPVLVEGARMPPPEHLPPDLAALPRRQCIELSHAQWEASSAQLIQALEKALAKGGTAPVPRRGRRALIGGIVAALLVAGIAALALLRPDKPQPEPPQPVRLTASAPSVEFGEQQVGSAGTPASVSIDNRGGTADAAASVALEGDAAGEFAIAQDECSGKRLAAAASCSVKLGFKPQRAGVRAATLVVSVGADVVGIALTGRGIEKLAAQPPAPKPPAPQVEPAKPQVEKPKPPPARILSFEAVAGTEGPRLCYALRDAVKARIEPQLGEVKPLPKECVSVAASKEPLVYTLTVSGADGASTSQRVTLPAAQPAARILNFEARPGADHVALCYGVENALRARILPEVGEVKPLPKECVNVPAASEPRVFTLSASGADGQTVTRRVKVDAATAALPERLPRKGDLWYYEYRSNWKNVAPQRFEYVVLRAAEGAVRERMRVLSVPEREDVHAFGPQMSVVERQAGGVVRREPNPYLQVLGTLAPDQSWSGFPVPREDAAYGDWYARGRVVGRETVAVPAGKFDAIKVEIHTNRHATNSPAMQASEPVHGHHVVWYAAEVKRAVKHVRTVYSARGSILDQDTYELVKYRVQ